MRNLRTVRHNGMSLIASQEVLDKMGLSNNQTINNTQMWQVIGLSAAQFVDDMERRQNAGEEGIPDTSELRERLDRLGFTTK